MQLNQIKIEDLILILASGSYIAYALKNYLFRPPPATFIIWTIVNFVNVYTYKGISEHWIGPLIMLLLDAAIVVIALVRARHWKQPLNRESKTCILIAVAVLLLRVFGQIDDLVGNMLVQVAVGIGFIPLLRSLIQDRKEEPIIPWFLFTVGFALVTWNIYSDPQFMTKSLFHRTVEISYPLVMGVIGDALVVVLTLRNKWLRW